MTFTLQQIPDTASGKNASTENFPVGSWLIRANLRRHVHAFYAFARAADDIADHPLLAAAEKVARLDQFAAALTNADDDTVAVAAELRHSLRETGVSPQHSLDLLTAFKRDATQLRYRDWDDLIDYCRYSANPVGRHVLALHGIGMEAWETNDALCTALQIINHLQDCADDYRELDRVYLPQDMLAANGGDLSDLAHEKSTPSLRKTQMDILDRVQPLMDKARHFPAHVPDGRLKMEVSVIASLAESLIALLRIKDPLQDKVKLNKAQIFIASIHGVGRAWL